jgi:ketosteroid isomerase-like protein
MSIKISLTCFIALAAFAGAAAADRTTLAEEVLGAEQAFAATMVARDHAAFTRHLAVDAVFFDGEKAVRGKAAIATAWKVFFERPNPPFSWTPESVEVLDSGALAYSSGPVFDPKGKRVGTFNSVWRREPDGAWRVVFDKACSACDCMKAQATSGDADDGDAARNLDASSAAHR